MATPDTKYFTIPEANTTKVARAVVQLMEFPARRMVHIKNMAPWQPDAVRFPQLGVVVSRMYDHLVEGRYMPSNEYRVTSEDGMVQINQLTTEDIIRKVREQQRPFIKRIIELSHFSASRNGHSQVVK